MPRCSVCAPTPSTCSTSTFYQHRVDSSAV
jgi:hypothetical protein